MESASTPEQNHPESMAAPEPLKRSPGLNGNGAVPGVCVLLALAVWLVFGQTLRHGFVNYDDEEYFYSNPHVQAGLTSAGMAWAFQTMYASNWHPLTWLSFMLDVELFGTGPAGPHLTNVLLHAANTVLLFLLLRRLTGTYWRSAWVAALFELHPLHVESVAWVAERKDVLSGLFFLLTLLTYARYVRGVTSGTGQVTRTGAATPAPDSCLVTRLPAEVPPGGTKAGHTSLFYILSLLFFALGLMSKPMLVTLPFVLLLLDYWPLERFTIYDLRFTIRRLAWEKVPFFVLSAASCGVTLLAQRQVIEPMEWLPLSLRISNVLVSYVTYLSQMFCPAGLAVFYPHPKTGLPLWEVTLSLILLAGISVGVLALRRMRPYLLVGWLWYLGMLVPVIGLVQVGGQGHADRYTYLPLIGVFVMLAWAAVDFFPSWQYRRQVLGAGALGMILALMACTWKQTVYWRNSESLWIHTLACTTGNYVAHNNLGILLAERGRFAEAIERYQRALEIRPDYVEAHNNLGIVLAGQGRSAEAVEHYQRALEIKPAYPEAHYNLGNFLAKQGRSTEAIEHFQKALEIKPDSTKVHYRLALALKHQGRFEAAIVHYKKVLELEPRPMLAENGLAWLLATCPDARLRNGDQAVELAQQAVQLSGGQHPEILDTLAAAYAEAGRFPEAVANAERALHLAEVRTNTILAQSIRDRLKLYEANVPYHEKP
jgi:tetratricopeptide (TPR) repeat protein